MYVITLVSISLGEESVAQAASLAEYNVSFSETNASVAEAGTSVAETGPSLVEAGAPASVPGVEEQRNECPPCESFFGKLERNDAGGFSQAVRMQVGKQSRARTPRYRRLCAVVWVDTWQYPVS